MLIPAGLCSRSRLPTPLLEAELCPPAPQQREGQFSSLQLVAMQRGVAAAMQYLSSFAFVHRALSAHSVLVNSHLVCKVARLGHSPQVRALPGGLSLFQRALETQLGPRVEPPVAYHSV